ncbi:MAG: hypothetical protein KDA88_00705 [Planctomycetaceae bacterium]|nr:hypothetical protein [Planctomycetaceae bacterium]MCB9953709.1 hypothetical protein [Planctomycetaceae bacterium]
MRDRRTIQTTLAGLRQRIRNYILVEGLSGVVAIACGLFWITYFVDLLHFQVSKLELPGWIRTLFLLAMAGTFLTTLCVWVFFRYFRSLRERALALVLERRFPELDDRLIAAVELMENPGDPTPLQREMQDQTIEQATQIASRLKLADVFEPTPLRRNLIVASVLMLTVLIFGVANTQAMGRWVDAFILGRPDYWEAFRQSELQVFVRTQPGNRRRDFSEDGILKHPRGADLELIAVSPDGKEAPDRVTLQYIGFGGDGIQRGRAPMTASAEGEFHHTLTRVIDDHDVWVRGGDFINRRPYRIQIVDPPRVDDIRLHCDYPSYTGKDGEEDRPVVVVGTQISLPMETSFDMQILANKPLYEVHLRAKLFELVCIRDRNTAQLTVIDPETEEKQLVEVQVAEQLFADDALSISVPMQVSLHSGFGTEELVDLTSLPLIIPSDTSLQITLIDQDEIYSPDPALVMINGIADLEPVVDTRLRGVSSVITRGASIPIQGRILDDYGVENAWFRYQVDESKDVGIRPLSRAPGGVREFPLEISSEEPVERFNVLPLELKVDQTLTVGVYAKDGDTLNGPHEGHGELFTFTIVSTDELLARLYDDEVNLRLRFEQIRDEIKDLRDSLTDNITLDAERQRLRGTPESAERDEELRKLDVTIASFADRAIHLIGKKHTESRSIEIGFRSLREELVNNRVDTKETLERIDDGVLQPLQVLNDEEFQSADESYGNFRLVNERQGETSGALEQAAVTTDAVLRRMDQILVEMRDRGTFNEFIQQLQKLIEEEKKLKEEIQKKQNESFFNDLGGN